MRASSKAGDFDDAHLTHVRYPTWFKERSWTFTRTSRDAGRKGNLVRAFPENRAIAGRDREDEDCSRTAVPADVGDPAEFQSVLRT